MPVGPVRVYRLIYYSNPCRRLQRINGKSGRPGRKMSNLLILRSASLREDGLNVKYIYDRWGRRIRL